MGQRDRDVVAIPVSGPEMLQAALSAALAAATGRVLREAGHTPSAEQLRALPGFFVRLAGVQAERSFAAGPPRVTQGDVDAWAEGLAHDLVWSLFGGPAVVN